jgi:3-oxoacyl-[acyl-carrier protein] reductase
MEGGTERWAVVAGGSGGIGRAIGRALISDGWNVALGYRNNAEGAEEVVAEAREAGCDGRAIQLDLGDAEGTAATIDQLAEDVRLAGLVYAAGPVLTMNYIAKTPAQEYGRIIDLDLKAAINFLQPGLTHIRERDGAVVALSTQAVGHYAKRDSLSSVPKAAVEGFVKGIAVEEGRFGTRANVVGVGMLEGEGMWQTMHDTGFYTEELLDAARKATPLGRFGLPADIAAVTRFLMSPEGGFVSGQRIYVDGGYSAASV